MGTHQPAVWMGDYGFLTIMPQVDQLKLAVKDRRATFSHRDELAKPYYYRVSYADATRKKIRTELTASERCGFFKITYPADGQPLLFIEAGRDEPGENFVQIVPELRQIRVYNAQRQDYRLGPPVPSFRGYYVLQFSDEFAAYGTWRDEQQFASAKQITGRHVGSFVRFRKRAARPVLVKIASSFISFDQARDNLARELPAWDFAAASARLKSAWQAKLAVVRTGAGPADDQAVFYTCLYHTLQFPRIFSEYGRYYSPFDGKIHRGISYNAYSLWDTFRAEHPLLCLTAPERVNGMMQGFVNMYKESGWLPKWPNPTFTNIMIATHADAVLADAYVKGFRGFDVQKAYEAVRKDAFVPPDRDTLKRWADRAPWTSYEARAGLTYYLRRGYVPADRTNESVSSTLEYALDDYCVAQMAKGLGRLADYRTLMQRTQNYHHVYNPETGLMAARTLAGQWTADPREGMTEGSQWTYLFCAMQDIPGLVKLMGGPAAFTKKLDENFSAGHYRHDNEPGHHLVYLYDYVGQPGKTQALVSQTMRANYLNKPDGLSGNDDCGQMSAWYVFSALGFYPVTPASGVYALGKPLFADASLLLNLPNQPPKTIRISQVNPGPRNQYVRRVTWNGKVLPTPFITHRQLGQGGTLRFYMSPAAPAAAAVSAAPASP